ncbi:hypothetical protein LOTGIDRAFT_162090 [Lottia gigantea]|uniref:Anaphase-promoting complex subunit 4 C-terminal half WD40 domain-containing protein n=1 Tax=Lottia gigantea TaxID=225164 RepID=V4A8J7_LOTGI|nr:hypothetical protein LOTGIDRAFT_162090 [Lottia gigantea]ESO93067.1 hypothetical protein LOTGIDRAFT_162090 [Lottia gigantea]
MNTNSKLSSDVFCKSNEHKLHLILDISYYDKKVLSLLLVEDIEDGRPVLVQLPFTVLKDTIFTKLSSTENITQNVNKVDVGPLIPKYSYRHLENMQAHSFAVSGTRKTATVLYSSKRRVRIFMLDGEEEDDSDEDEEEEEEADNSNLEVNENENTNNLDTSTPMEEDENKENTSV